MEVPKAPLMEERRAFLWAVSRHRGTFDPSSEAADCRLEEAVSCRASVPGSPGCSLHAVWAHTGVSGGFS